MKSIQLTAARRWVLECAALSRVEGGYGGPAVIQSFKTGETTYGHTARTIEKCTEAGWIDDMGRITDSGRKALTAEKEAA